MGLSQLPSRGTWNAYGTTTQTAGTKITLLCPPYPGQMAPASPPFLYKLDSQGLPNWWGKNSGVTKVSLLAYLCGSTSHQLKFMRPTNFTTVASAAAINQAVINIAADPGVFSTNYKYPKNITTATAAVADDPIDTGDWVVYQLSDGTWVFDTVASVVGLAVTMTTNIPNITGGGVNAGAPFFLMEIATDKEPASGYAPTIYYVPASVLTTIQDDNGFFSGLHAGDPLLFQADNATAAGFVTMLSGYYGAY